jgi:3-oxoacyl-[acyl-carrier protein] reductase
MILSQMNFTGKRVLIVGGSSGIGNGIAQAFRANGAEVHVWGTRSDPSTYKASEGSDLTGLHYSKVDVAVQAEVEAWKPPFDTLDILIPCQGTVMYGRAEFEMENFRKVVEVNLNSVMTCAIKFHAMLKASKGSMIIVSSDAAFHSTKGNPAYNASKTGAVGLTRTLAEAWARDGIRVNGLAPGLVPSKLTAISTDHPERLQRYIDRIPMRRAGTPADMAGVALFLASPLASYVLGQTLQVDGGMLLA